MLKFRFEGSKSAELKGRYTDLGERLRDVGARLAVVLLQNVAVGCVEPGIGEELLRDARALARDAEEVLAIAKACPQNTQNRQRIINGVQAMVDESKVFVSQADEYFNNDAHACRMR